MPLPELPETAATTAPIEVAFTTIASDATLRWSPLWLRANGTPWAEAARSRGAYYVRVGGFATFRATATRLEVDANPAVRPSTIRHLLLDQVLPLALAAEGALVLHASAVRRGGDGLVAIAGDAGSGKSTLAAALAREGWAVASDDGVVVVEEAGRWDAVPAYAGLRVWADAAAATGLTDRAVSEVAEYSAKLRVTLPDEASMDPLHAVVAIQAADRFHLERLTPREATMALVRHAYRADLTDRAALAAQLDTCARAATGVPVFRAHVPHDFTRLAAVTRDLSKELGVLGSEFEVRSSEFS